MPSQTVERPTVTQRPSGLSPGPPTEAARSSTAIYVAEEKARRRARGGRAPSAPTLAHTDLRRRAREVARRGRARAPPIGPRSSGSRAKGSAATGGARVGRGAARRRLNAHDALAVQSVEASVAVIIGLAVLAPACTRPATQLVVVVDSDITSLTEVWARAVPTDPPAGHVPSDATFVLGPGRTSVPFSFGVTPPLGDPRRRVEVTVEGRATPGGPALVVRRVRTGFLEGQRLLLPIFLADACRNVDCSTGCSWRGPTRRPRRERTPSRTLWRDTTEVARSPVSARR